VIKLEETLDGYYKIGQRYSEIGILGDLVTCFAGGRDSNSICKTKCGGVQLFGADGYGPICGYINSGKHEFERLDR